MNGRRYKRVTLPDASVAAQVERNLATFRHAGIFPALVATVDNEILLEFVSGASPGERFDASRIDGLAGFDYDMGDTNTDDVFDDPLGIAVPWEEKYGKEGETSAGGDEPTAGKTDDDSA